MGINLDNVVHKFLVEPGSKMSLKQFKTDYPLGDHKKSDLKLQLLEGIQLLAQEQSKLYADNKYAILLVLQAMDAAGKDSTIKHVMSGINPQGCQVYSFKAPSVEELDHDYMWRCAKALPERGNIGIFNRSYYEEVIVSRVHPEILNRQQLPEALKDKGIWSRRFEEMNYFEKYLVNNGIIVLKVFLHVSHEEQKRRFLERIEMPDKNWKFSSDDARDRALWPEYMKAYEDCFNNTSTKWAPWHIVPADYKPFARLVVNHLVYRTMKDLKLKYPTVTKQQKEELEKARHILEGEGSKKSAAAK